MTTPQQHSLESKPRVSDYVRRLPSAPGIIMRNLPRIEKTIRAQQADGNFQLKDTKLSREFGKLFFQYCLVIARTHGLIDSPRKPTPGFRFEFPESSLSILQKGWRFIEGSLQGAILSFVDWLEKVDAESLSLFEIGTPKQTRKSAAKRGNEEAEEKTNRAKTPLTREAKRQQQNALLLGIYKDHPHWTMKQIASAAGVSCSTVYRCKALKNIRNINNKESLEKYRPPSSKVFVVDEKSGNGCYDIYDERDDFRKHLDS